MKTVRTKVLVLEISFVLFIFSCNSSFDNIEKSTKSMAKSLDNRFSLIRSNLHNLTKAAEAAFKGSSMDGEDVASLIDNGTLSLFKSAQGTILFSNPKAEVSFYLSPAEKISADIDRASRIMLGLGKSTHLLHQEDRDILTVYFIGLHLPESVVVMSPYVNTSALFPPNIDVSQFEWFQRGLKSVDGGLWSEEPFTDLSIGWTQDLAESFNTGLPEKGVAIVGINIRLVASYLQSLDPKSNYLLLSPNHTVIIASPAMKSILPLTDLGTVDFTAQTVQNHYAGEEYRLAGPKQAPVLHTLEDLLQKSGTNFELVHEGKNFKVSQAALPEVRWTLVMME